ncbi:MAG: hypothetical protein GF355_00295, partial [Candidatus Eisenbacteria bacterium]|nr:hypothetical protein [Candidatus Eisenbacteria bacterium]
MKPLRDVGPANDAETWANAPARTSGSGSTGMRTGSVSGGMQMMTSGRGVLAFFGAAVLIALLLVPNESAADTERRIEELEFPELGDIDVPEPRREELSNGLVVFLLEDHEFPIVDLNADFRTGAIYEPKEKAGLAWLTGEVMRSGGSAAYPGDELDLQLESIGARIETRIGETSGSASLSTLTEDLDLGLKMFTDVLQRPAFPDEKIDLAKVEMRTSISSRNDQAGSILRREFDKIVYGEDSPYGWHTEYATVEAISREDVVAFHDTYVRPDRMILTVYGDFDTEEILKSLEELLGSWPRAAAPLPPAPAMPAPKPPRVHYAHKEGTTASSIALGHLGFRADDPDYSTMNVLNRILGAGFSSRLFREIRSRMGLAYSVRSSAGVGYHHPGVFAARVETRIDSTVKTTRAILDQLQKIR